MYERFYGFAEKPFNLTPDPDYFYLSSVHKRALDHLVYGLESGMGFIQVTGEIGSGKTTLIKCLLRQLSREVKVAYVIHSKGTFVQILRMILEDLEVVPADQKLTKEALLSRFRDYLVEQARYHNSVVVIIDEAQNLPLEVLEELRMLSNFETEKAKLLQIVLVGQPELRDLLRRPELEQLRQRITVRFHLYPLNEEETRSYIRHRLKVAGSNGSVRFTAAASRLVHRYSGGLPRLINVACDATLLAGFVDERRVFNDHFVREALRELADDRAATLEEPPRASSAPAPVGPASAPRPARGRALAAAVAVLLALGLAAALFLVQRGTAGPVGEFWRTVMGR
ncbi:MAG TPA: AAA family ATPase [Planctomycetota bacterium]|nr:AAA family ATPase [Planctomycetota bacterium]